MITVAHALDDMELLFLRMALEGENIPFLIVGEHFGSLYPGVQIPIYNERPIRVFPSDAERALKVIDEVRGKYDSVAVNLSGGSKIRMVLEAIFFAWFVPCGRRKLSSIRNGKQDEQSLRAERS